MPAILCRYGCYCSDIISGAKRLAKLHFFLLLFVCFFFGGGGGGIVPRPNSVSGNETNATRVRTCVYVRQSVLLFE